MQRQGTIERGLSNAVEGDGEMPGPLPPEGSPEVSASVACASCTTTVAFSAPESGASAKPRLVSRRQPCLRRQRAGWGGGGRQEVS